MKTRKGKAAEIGELVMSVGVAVRKMGAQSVVTSKTIADRFGLHTTDLEVLDLIYLREQASAGELAQATGLTSGSVTALIDRLVTAGYVERCDDPVDRRKVLVRIRHEAVEPIKAVYMVSQRRMFALWSTYSARDLQVIADFLVRSTALAVERCKELQLEAVSSGARARVLRTSRDTGRVNRRFTGAARRAATRKRPARLSYGGNTDAKE